MLYILDVAAERPLSAFASPDCAAGGIAKRPATSELREIIYRGTWPLKMSIYLYIFIRYWSWKIIVLSMHHTRGVVGGIRRDQNQNQVIKHLVVRVVQASLSHDHRPIAVAFCCFFFPARRSKPWETAARRGPAPHYSICMTQTSRWGCRTNGASHVSAALHLFDCIFTQEHNYQYREPLVKASKPVVLTRD